MQILVICYNKVGDFMRLRNVKGAKEMIEKSNYIVLEPSKYKNKFTYLHHYNNIIIIFIYRNHYINKHNSTLILNNPIK